MTPGAYPLSLGPARWSTSVVLSWPIPVLTLGDVEMVIELVGQQHLSDKVGQIVERRMRAAYCNPDPLVGQAQMEALAAELERSHPGAAASLREGLDETFTVARLGVPPTLARTVRSTNRSSR